jgi:hypothetical protein
MGEKTLCKWGEKQIEKRMKKLKKIVSNPSHVCKKCGRAASNEKVLCKPVSIQEK